MARLFFYGISDNCTTDGPTEIFTVPLSPSVMRPLGMRHVACSLYVCMYVCMNVGL
jgi:hypothetical protein